MCTHKRPQNLTTVCLPTLTAIASLPRGSRLIHQPTPATEQPPLESVGSARQQEQEEVKQQKQSSRSAAGEARKPKRILLEARPSASSGGVSDTPADARGLTQPASPNIESPRMTSNHRTESIGDSSSSPRIGSPHRDADPATLVQERTNAIAKNLELIEYVL